MWSHGDGDFVTAKETVKLRPITCVSWSVSSGSTTFFIIISQFWKNKILVCTLYEVFIDLFYFESCMNEFSWLKMIFLAKIKKILVVFCFYLDSFSFNFFNTINWSFISLTSGSTLRSSQTIWILKNV